MADRKNLLIIDCRLVQACMPLLELAPRRGLLDKRRKVEERFSGRKKYFRPVTKHVTSRRITRTVVGSDCASPSAGEILRRRGTYLTASALAGPFCFRSVIVQDRRRCGRAAEGCSDCVLQIQSERLMRFAFAIPLIDSEIVLEVSSRKMEQLSSPQTLGWDVAWLVRNSRP